MMSNQSRSRGTAKYSRLRLNSSNKDSKTNSNKVESISKYFIKTSDEINESEQEPLQITNLPEYIPTFMDAEVKSIINDDDNDFKSPMPIKIAKIFQKTQNKASKNKKTETKRKYNTRKTTLIQQTIEDNFKNNSVNAEHLQMAIALSKSEDDARNPSQIQTDVDVLAPIFPSTQKIHENARRVLEQFGFVSKKSNAEVTYKRVDIEVNKRKHKSKFYYITPTLMLRTPEDRERLINEKLSYILKSATQFLENRKRHTRNNLNPISDTLRKQCVKNSVFSINNLQQDELLIDYFYVSALNLTKSNFNCGSFLKKWENIPGRDLSPIRSKRNDLNLSVEIVNESNLNNFESKPNDSTCNSGEVGTLDASNIIVNTPHTKNRKNHCLSPDLFDSDEEKCNTSPINNYNFCKNVDVDQTFVKENLLLKSNLNALISSNNKLQESYSNKLTTQNMDLDRSCDDKNRVTPIIESGYGLKKKVKLNSRNSLEEASMLNLELTCEADGQSARISNHKFQRFRSCNNLELNSYKSKSQTPTSSHRFKRFNSLNYTKKCATPDLELNSCEKSSIIASSCRLKEFNTQKNSFQIKSSTITSNQSLKQFNSMNHPEEYSIPDLSLNSCETEFERPLIAVDHTVELNSKGESPVTIPRNYLEKSSTLNIDSIFHKTDVQSAINTSSHKVSSRNQLNESSNPKVGLKSCKTADPSSLCHKLNNYADECSTPNLELNYYGNETFANNILDKDDKLSPIIAKLRPLSRKLSSKSLLPTLSDSKLKPVGIDIMSASLLSNLYENKNFDEKEDIDDDDLYMDGSGICHFESFHEPEEKLFNLSQVACDFVVGDKNISEYKTDTSLNVTDYIKNVLNQSNTDLKKYDSESSDDGIANLSQSNEDFKRNYSMNNITRISSSSESENEDLQLSQNEVNNSAKNKPEIIAISDSEDEIVPSQSKKEFKKCMSNVSIESNASQESICISDEELNYSSYAHQNVVELEEKNYASRESLCMSDEELNYSSHPITELKEKGDDIVKSCNNIDENEISLTCILEQLDIENNLQNSYNICTTSQNNDMICLKENEIINTDEIDMIEGGNINNATTPKSSLKKPVCILPNLDDTFPSFRSIDLIKAKTDIAELEVNISPKTPKHSNESKLVHPRIKELGTKQIKSMKIKLVHEGSVRSSEVDSSPDNMIIKADNVTPMANYDEMNTPKIVTELEKYGLKALKRRRGVALLKYIYEATHPVLAATEANINAVEDENRIIKRRKRNSDINQIEPQIHSEVVEASILDVERISIVGDINECSEYIFERKRSKKIHSCQLPLHIAWHNLVSSNSELQEKILLYEPLQVEVLYKMLNTEGFKYHIQDLIRFLDKKCITIRTKQGNSKTKQLAK